MQFPTPAPITAVIAVPAGRVQVIAADRPDTVVEIRPARPSSGRDVKAAERTRATFHDGVLRVESTAKDRLLGPSGSAEVTVRLPAGSRVEVATAGEVRGVGRLGDVTVQGATGPVKLDEASSVRLDVAAGDVRVGRLTGSGEVTVARGDVEITEAVRGTLALTVQSGAITVGAAPGVSAALDAATPHGRVTNALRNDGAVALDVRATTSHGDIVARSL
ncbi:DUF4097 family beta strand repeat-containing protein [Actinomadura flavalba]|uniref:DUF4097 family beta strand repeat-containing protein n=1 Tax=Actinomadura flavalba TaxID=1120938 RepID=UPI00037B5A96|nr:DUF4097 family beta strand repeat-containing protein [Actinomadura flavalba]